MGAVAQLGEHLLCKQGVTGSIPVSSTKKHYWWQGGWNSKGNNVKAKNERSADCLKLKICKRQILNFEQRCSSTAEAVMKGGGVKSAVPRESCAR